MIAAALTVALLFDAGAAISVAGDSTCPTPAEVADHLSRVLPTATSSAAARGTPTGTRVFVTRTGGTLRLVLSGLDGKELASRELATEGTCGDLAAAAAIVVGAWRADLDPALTPAVTLPEVALPVTSPTLVAREAPRPPVRPPRPFALGLGLIASETGGSLAPGAALTGWLALGPHLALDASLLGTTSRSADVGTMGGVASWTRGTFAVGPALAIRHEQIRAAAHLKALGALLHVRGVGVPNPASDTTPEVGGGAGAKLEIATGTSAVWVGVDLFVWPGDQRLIIRNVSDQGHLSRVEIVAGAGLSLGRFP